MEKRLVFKESEKYYFTSQYQYVKHIGNGSFGGVYVFEDSYFRRKVAIKFYNDLDFSIRKKSDYDAFLNEAKILLNINHVNIVRFYNILQIIGHSEKKPSIVMEYIEGEKINKYLSSNTDKINNIFLQLIQVFEYLEKKNVCHGDISYNNILINNCGIVKLIDFGLSKRIKEKASYASYTIKSSIKLNRPLQIYAPEEEKMKYYPKTDQFYLGNLFKQLCNEYSIHDFKYLDIVEKMGVHDEDQRYISFSEILDSIDLSNTPKIKNFTMNFTPKEKENYNQICEAFFKKDIRVLGNIYYSIDSYSVDDSIDSIKKYFIERLFHTLDSLELRQNFKIECFLNKLGFTGNYRMDSPISSTVEIPVNILLELYDFITNINDKEKREKISSDFCDRLVDVFYIEGTYDLPF